MASAFVLNHAKEAKEKKGAGSGTLSVYLLYQNWIVCLPALVVMDPGKAVFENE